MGRRSKPRRTPDGFRWQGNKLVPVTNEPKEVTPDQSLINGGGRRQDPHWSSPEVGGGGHETAPGATPVPASSSAPSTTPDDDDEDDNVMTSDDDGRMPDEPGYMQGPDWKPPFQTNEGDDPTDAEIAFMMDDANYDTGGNLNTTNTDTGDNIETFELGAGIGEEGGWKPTPFRKKSGKGTGQSAPDGNKAQSGNLRRNIRKLSPSLITSNV